MAHSVCDTCGHPDSTMVEGMCGGCRRRYVQPELITADRLLQVLAWHVGASNGVPVNGLMDLCQGQVIAEPDRAAAARHIRRLVEELREQGHHVCAHPSTGYFIAETAQELEDTCTFLYARALSSLTKIAAMKRVSVPDLRGQLRLQT